MGSSHSTQAKTEAALTAAAPQVSPFQSRGFEVDSEQTGTTEQGQSTPSIQARLDRAARLGHNFANISVISPASTTAQRQTEPEEEEEALQTKPDLQRAGGGGDATPELESSIQSAKGGGQPLGSDIRRSMEGAFGADFSGVRVHTDSQADTLNRSIQAQAFTTGQDVFFRSGSYDPGSSSGKELLAHELTHVVQQSGGQVSKPQAKLTIGEPGDQYEQEADAMAAQVVQRIEEGDQVQRQSQSSDPQTLLQRLPDGEVTFDGGIMRYVDSSLQAKAETIQRQDKGEEQSDEGTRGNPIVYGATTNLNWQWSLTEQDTISGDDTAARFQVAMTFGQVALQGGDSAWVIDEVNASKQTARGLTGEAHSLTSRFFLVGGQLVFDVRIQFRFKTDDVTETSNTTIGASLSASEKATLGASLPVRGVDVEAGVESGRGAGLNLTKSWGSEQVVSGASFDVTRNFRFTNQAGSSQASCAIVETFDPDPGMIGSIAGTNDQFLWDQASYTMQDNDDVITAGLS